MKTTTIILLTSLILACSNSENKTLASAKNQEVINEDQNKKVIKSVLDCNTFEENLQKDSTIQLIDVRTPSEFEGGYIANAVNININDPEFKNTINQLDKTKPVYVYCASGGRSGRASDYLIEQGFSQVYDLNGGFSLWRAEGKEFISN